MNARKVFWSLTFFLAACWSPWSSFADDDLAGDDVAGVVQLDVFVRGDKPSANEVTDYVTQLKRRNPGLEVITRDVIQDRGHLKRLYELTKRAGRSKPVVPVFHCCDRMYFGFEGSAKSGPAIEDLFMADIDTRDTCPRCADAKVFIETLKRTLAGNPFSRA